MRGERRMIDANWNRAREALRAIEDIARFSLDDPGLCARLKTMRHDLTAALTESTGSRADLVSERDTAGDVGTSITTRAESRRGSLLEVAQAALARLSESLRVIEECLKLTSPLHAARVEQIRYASYELERDMLPNLARPDPEMRVCLLLSESLCTHHPWEVVAREAIESGVDGIQLREKSLEDAELLERTEKLVHMARPAGVRVIINDRADIARLVDADGVHLGRGDLPICAAREIVGSHRLIGKSTSTAGEIRVAAEEGADMVGIGPVFVSSTKPKPGVLGALGLGGVLDELSSDADAGDMPHLAISGIHGGNVRELVAVGCRGVAVSSAVCSAEDPGQVVRELALAMRGAGAPAGE